MIFIICIIIGALGVAGTLWMSAASLRYLEHPVAQGREWFRISPELYESGLTMRMREHFRRALKEVLVWLIALYRRVSRKVTVKQVVKKHVRAFLYDHAPDGTRTPSEFWHRVKPAEAPRAIESPEIVETVVVEEAVVHQEPAPRLRRPRRTRKPDVVGEEASPTHDTDNAPL